jgi:hypothetical protein
VQDNAQFLTHAIEVCLALIHVCDYIGFYFDVRNQAAPSLR